ncbi:hypothetical protein AVEN_968-1 [Araneus ventricosus]|uniref:Uncharacterized protein n=1 Tax=Araneus ventricosus TaxID=182803 RepID=A0A4Y2CXX0_ARAVE|nr:hypothetical protein AVEN_968-1 [Araneus ventricosus]
MYAWNPASRSIEAKWKRCLELEYFQSELGTLLATGLIDKEEKSSNFTFIGRDNFLIYQHLNTSSEKRKDSNAIIEALTKYFEPAVNVIHEKMYFYCSSVRG